MEKSAIRIQKDDLDTSLNTPVLCRQCKEMKCLHGEEETKDSEKKEFYLGQNQSRAVSFQRPDCFR